MPDKVQIIIEVASKSDIAALINQFKQLGQVADVNVQKAVDAADKQSRKASEAINKQIQEQQRMDREIAAIEVRRLRRAEDQELQLERIRQRSIEKQMRDSDRLMQQEERRRKTQEREEEASAQRRARFALTPLLGTTGNSGALGAALQGAGALGLGGGGTGAGVASGVLASFGGAAIAVASLTAAAVGAASALTMLILSANKAALDTANFASRTGMSNDRALLMERMASREGTSASSLVQVGRYISNLTDPKADPRGWQAFQALQNRTSPMNLLNPNGSPRNVGDLTFDLLQRLSQLPRGDALQRRWESLLEGRGAAGMQPIIENFSRDFGIESASMAATGAGSAIAGNASRGRTFNSLKNVVSNMTQSFAAHPLDFFSPSGVPYMPSGVLSGISAAGAAVSTRGAGPAQAGATNTGVDIPAPPSLTMSFSNDDEGDAEKMTQLKQDLPTYEMIARGNGAGSAARSKAATYVGQIKSEIARIQNKPKFRALKIADEQFMSSTFKGLGDTLARAQGKETGEGTAAYYAEHRNELLLHNATPGEMKAYDATTGQIVALGKQAENQRLSDFQRRADIDVQSSLARGTDSLSLARVMSLNRGDAAGQRAANRAALGSAIGEANRGFDDAMASVTNLKGEAAEQQKITAEKERQKALNEAAIEYAKKNLEITKQEAAEEERFSKQMASINISGQRSVAQARIRGGSRVTAARYGRGEEGLASIAADRASKQEALDLFKLELAATNQITDSKEKQLEVRKLEWQYALDMVNIEEQHEIKMAEYERQRVERMKNTYGSIFDAMTHQGGMRNLFAGFSKTMFENVMGVAAEHHMLPDLGKMIGGQTTVDKNGNPQLTTIGKILKGTPLGVDQASLDMQMNIKSTVDNTKATMDLTTAIQKAAGIDPNNGSSTGSGSGSSGVLGALSNLPLIGPYTSGAGNALSSIAGLAAIAGAAGAGAAASGIAASGIPSLPEITGGVVGTGMPSPHTSFGSNYKTPISTLFDPKASTGAKVGAGIASAGVILASAQDLQHNLSVGGVRGGLGTAQDILGMASLIPGPVGMVAMAGSAVLGMVKGIMGDPRAHQQYKIDQYLQGAKFLAPTQLNETISTSGTFADYGMRGSVRNSTFNPTPTVTQPFVDKWKQGTAPGWLPDFNFIDPKYVYTTVPGQTTGQFGGNVHPMGGPAAAPTSVAAPTVIIQAMDQQGFIRNAPAIAAGLHAAINSGQADLLMKTIGNRVNPK